MYNASSIPVHSFNKTRFGSFVEYDQNGIYLVDSNHVFPATGNIKSWTFRTTKLIITITSAYAMTFQTKLSIFITGPAKLVMETNFPTVYDLVILNGVIIYGSPALQQSFFNVMNSYPSIWRDSGKTINVPEKQWLPINTKTCAKIDAVKMYPVGPQNRILIDKNFDELH